MDFTCALDCFKRFFSKWQPASFEDKCFFLNRRGMNVFNLSPKQGFPIRILNYLIVKIHGYPPCT